MSPLAAAVYDVLRRRTGLPDPRITYAELAEQLRDTSEDLFDVLPPPTAPPALGQDTDAVLTQLLGLDAARLEELRRRGVI